MVCLQGHVQEKIIIELNFEFWWFWTSQTLKNYTVSEITSTYIEVTDVLKWVFEKKYNIPILLLWYLIEDMSQENEV